jgi:hypothetical protein
VVFNGTKAEGSFRKNVSLDSSTEKRLLFRKVPSSSTANTVKAEVKRTEWMSIKAYLDGQRAHS